MAEMYIGISEVETHLNTAENHGSGRLRVNAFMNDEIPSISLSISKGRRTEIADFYIDGEADIDALRRYCEMALAHFKSGILA